MEKKEDIRRKLLKLRTEQSEYDWEIRTEAIKKKIAGHRWFIDAEKIFCYMDFRGEVGTRGIIEEAWKLGKRVYVPRMDGDRMEFYEIASLSDVRLGAFGIMEPWKGTRDDSSCGRGLVILPGVAFDRAGNRIGYGKGCYDRFLADHRDMHTIGIAFELQIVDRIETEKTDIRAELLVTEKGVYE